MTVQKSTTITTYDELVSRISGCLRAGREPDADDVELLTCATQAYGEALAFAAGDLTADPHIADRRLKYTASISEGAIKWGIALGDAAVPG